MEFVNFVNLTVVARRNSRKHLMAVARHSVHQEQKAPGTQWPQPTPLWLNRNGCCDGIISHGPDLQQIASSHMKHPCSPLAIFSSDSVLIRGGIFLLFLIEYWGSHLTIRSDTA